MATLPEQLERLEASVTRAGGSCTGRATGRRRTRSWPASPRRTGRARSIKVKSMATDEIGLNDALAARGDQAIETDLAELIVQLGHDRQSHILVPAIHRNRRRSRRCSSARSPTRQLGTRGVGDRRGRAAPPAREVPVRADGGVGRELRGRRDRDGGGRRVRGQRAHVHDAARGARDRHGDREGAARVARPRGLPAAAAALVDRRADEPLHVAVDRRARRRRAAGVPPRAARRRADRRARRRGRPPGAALHPLLGLPQRVPGLLARRRPRLRVGLSGADRGDPHAAAVRARPRADAAVGLLAVRRLLRGLPGQDRHPELLVHLRGRVVREQKRRTDPRR